MKTKAEELINEIQQDIKGLVYELMDLQTIQICMLQPDITEKGVAMSLLDLTKALQLTTEAISKTMLHTKTILTKYEPEAYKQLPPRMKALYDKQKNLIVKSVGKLDSIKGSPTKGGK